MIKLNNLNKYFNKGKSNEIHVINNINLTFPKKGLVVLLGPSGSGKTTLLNVVGGLDKINKGSIEFDDVILNKYKSSSWDKIRNDSIGYVFQNYNLLTDLTVSENIELVLKMSGIINQDEITKRIEYILKSVGMYNYRRRKASALSGGQQQRIAIARALAKNPKVIIADEPTGNLDSRNTLEIMNIIKTISKEKLVLLVSHEKEIAEFYADRIIEISDGLVINDYTNEKSSDLAVSDDNAIYLKDLSKDSKGVNNNLSVDFYYDEMPSHLDKLDIKLIMKNNTLYIDVENKEKIRVKYIDTSSDVKLLDKHYEAVKQDDLKDFDFNFEGIVDDTLKTSKNASAISFKDSVKYALKKVASLSRGGKLMYLGFALGAMIIAFCVSFLGYAYAENESQYITLDKHYAKYYNNEISFDELLALEDLDNVEKVNFVTKSQSYFINGINYYQNNQDYQTSIYGHVSSIEFLSENDVIAGEFPTNSKGILIDKQIVEAIYKDYQFKSYDFNSYKDVLQLKIPLKALLPGVTGNISEFDVKIVGIVDTGSRTLFMDESIIYSLNAPMCDIEFFDKSLTIVEGQRPNNIDEIIVPSTSSFSIGDSHSIYSGGESENTYKVVGKYDLNSNSIFLSTGSFLTNLNTLKKITFQNHKSALLYTNDMNSLLKQFEDDTNVTIKDSYKDDLENYKDDNSRQITVAFIFSGFTFFVSAISLFFIIRSSLFSRIYEVSVYRALGATKNDIRKMFVIEILIITTVSSMIGYALMSGLILQMQAEYEQFSQFLYLPFSYVIYGAIAIYTINILSGLLPVNMLLRNTPAQILSKYDI